MSDFDDELTIANKLLGVTVRRAPINFVGEIKTKEDKKLVREKVKHGTPYGDLCKTGDCRESNCHQ